MIYKRPFRVAILDMNNGVDNQGIRGINEILYKFNGTIDADVLIQQFRVRDKGEIPDLSFDVYISSGGPGSPFDGLNKEWEVNYFKFLEQIVQHNHSHSFKKYLLLICHSFQLACRYFKIAKVIPRYSNAFGVFPVYLTADGENSVLYQNLPNPFFALDSRDWQVVEVDQQQLDNLGALVTALEKDRPNVDFERCIMGVQFSAEIMGTQFHPEADPAGLKGYFAQLEKKRAILAVHSEEKFDDVIGSLENPERINHTYNTIIPNFLNMAISNWYSNISRE